MSALFKVGTINNISRVGLKRFPQSLYQIGALDEDAPLDSPMALMLRSHKLQNDQVGKSVTAIARCGAGTNNIPVDEMTGRGIPVFNTPGANANSVKELVLCSLFLSARNIVGGINHVQALTDKEGFEVAGGRVEKDKKLFAGSEVKGKTLGIIGLGAIGAQVAMAGSALGMKVIGYDPALTVEAAWNLDGEKIKRVNELESVVAGADYVSLHVPVIKGVTENLMNDELIDMMRPGASLLNFSRGELVDHAALRDAMDSGKFTGTYCTDFPNGHVQGHAQCIGVPHLGASTDEAEENSAAMAADTIMNFLETGSIKNSVNFPTTLLKKRKGDTTRICIVNENTSGMLMKINNVLYETGLNVDQQINTSRDRISYNVIDVDSTVEMEDFTPLHNQLNDIDGILSVRIIAGDDRDHQSYRAQLFPRQMSRV
jgi:D-3-phosphoglycerate dehydrogenase / 2-oxoglutarate reductase